MGLEVSSSEMVYFFKLADADGSGKIDVDEFIEVAKHIPLFNDTRAFQSSMMGRVRCNRCNRCNRR